MRASTAPITRCKRALAAFDRVACRAELGARLRNGVMQAQSPALPLDERQGAEDPEKITDHGP